MGHDDGLPTGRDDSGDAPLALLAELGYPASDRFLVRVRGSIERRLLVSHVATGVWLVPFAVVLQFVLIAIESIAPARRPRG